MKHLNSWGQVQATLRMSLLLEKPRDKMFHGKKIHNNLLKKYPGSSSGIRLLKWLKELKEKIRVCIQWAVMLYPDDKC